MNDVKFLKREAIAFGRKKAIKHIGFFIGMMFILSAVVTLPHEVIGAFGKVKIIRSITILIQTVFLFEIMAGIIKSLLVIVDRTKPALGELFSCLFSCFDKRILNMFIASLLYGIMVFMSMAPCIIMNIKFKFFPATLLLIVPSIILATKHIFFGFCIVDKNVGIMESFKKSAEMTNGSKINIFLLGLILLLYIFAAPRGFVEIGCFISPTVASLGILLYIVTIPLSMLAVAYVYRKLEGYSTFPLVEKAKSNQAEELRTK